MVWGVGCLFSEIESADRGGGFSVTSLAGHSYHLPQAALLAFICQPGHAVALPVSLYVSVCPSCFFRHPISFSICSSFRLSASNLFVFPLTIFYASLSPTLSLARFCNLSHSLLLTLSLSLSLIISIFLNLIPIVLSFSIFL